MALKVVITGPACAGKTTFVRLLSERKSSSAEAVSTALSEKRHTTVGLDVGVLEIAGTAVTLVGTPGQERFAYMWDILASGADGVVLLIPADQPNPIADASNIVPHLTASSQLPIGIGVTRGDLARDPVLPDVRARFSSLAALITSIDGRAVGECRALLARLVREYI